MAKKKATGRQSQQLKVDYIKSNAFRVVHADGALGGLTPRLDIHMSFWSERFPIPKEIVYEIDQGAMTGKEIGQLRVAREGLVREVEVGVVMNLETAKVFHRWFGDKIESAEKTKHEIQKKTAGSRNQATKIDEPNDGESQDVVYELHGYNT